MLQIDVLDVINRCFRNNGIQNMKISVPELGLTTITKTVLFRQRNYFDPIVFKALLNEKGIFLLFWGK